MITNLWPPNHVSDAIAWCCSTIGSPVWFNLPSIKGKSPTLHLAKANYTPPCVTFGVIQGLYLFQQLSLHIDLPIWPKDFEFWFVTRKDFALLIYCPVFVHLTYWSLLTLFHFFNIGLLTTMLLCWSVSQSLLTVDGKTFLTTLVQFFNDVWCSHPAVKQASAWLIVPYIDKRGCI